MSVPGNYTAMYLTQETRRTRWIGLLLAWAALGFLVFWYNAVYRDYIRLLDSLALRGASAPATPLKRSCPTMYADAQMWVRHALSLADGAGPQLRYTHVDNAPVGREVHWDSGFAWLILGAGELRHLLTREPLPTAVEESMAWINAPLLLAFIGGFSWWVARRTGLGAGVLLGFAMLANPDFFGGFAPNYIDHHGLLAAAVLGLFLGGVFMGAGFRRTSESRSQLLPESIEAARRAAIFSAVCGAFGMWISAATLIPAIAIMGIAGAMGNLLYGGGKSAKEGVILEPELWRMWGRVGGILSLVFYLLEYAPSHLGFRMEVNHPAYAFGWWGGSEIIAQLAEWRRDRRWPKARGRWLTAALVSVLVAPAIIAIGGERVFVVMDPFVSRLSEHVAEGISFFVQAKIFGLGRLWQEAPWIGSALALMGFLWWRAHRLDRAMVFFCTITFLASLVMALKQVRWWSSACGPEICLMLLAVIQLSTDRRRWVGWFWVGIGAAAMTIPAVSRVTEQRSLTAHRVVDTNDVVQPFYRDIAQILRASQPKGEIVLLSSPNGSVAIGYYGEFKTIGTLYWENLEGTKAAAAMFSAQSEGEARRLLRDRGVTHVAMLSYESFLTEYFSLLNPGGTQQQFQNSFGYKLLVNQEVPLWLEPIPYVYPPDLPPKVDRVGLYKTRFYGPQAEADYDEALNDFSANRLAEGEAKLDAALALAPDSAEFWVVKGHLRLMVHDLAGATQAVNAAINHLAGIQQLALCQAEAGSFYQQHAEGAAAQLYRRALSIQFNPTMANNLAWILATSSDDRVRNGAEALKLAQKLAAQNESVACLASYAAALAECRRYDDAVTVQSRGLELAKTSNNQTAAANAEARLAAYRSGKPWRE